ncbi:hypothetical protein BOTBODRAFT_175286 [Botryobasidium botryosum FD-172 SS1]|uniref:RlpA-like protein double-psi beta-barrel domain-containing protein n=1 Tax=Botryobasidium botryosum (strain FD-172 SS1) TaxID=930990 RepID=A0A067MQM4_BOTB1|nr:hypothetical protein BOTBODRAFT_175286 [Botryobasidium botryosum FD-172 SS1]
MFFKKSLAVAAFAAASFVAAQSSGTAILADYTYPNSITCGLSTCPISGEWIGVNQTFFNTHGCGTVLTLTTEDNSRTTTAPVCDICDDCPITYFKVPPVVQGELGGGVSIPLTVNWHT